MVIRSWRFVTRDSWLGIRDSAVDLGREAGGQGGRDKGLNRPLILLFIGSCKGPGANIEWLLAAITVSESTVSPSSNISWLANHRSCGLLGEAQGMRPERVRGKWRA